MNANEQSQVTVLLAKAGSGDQSAKQELFQRVELELRAIADRYMRAERADHSLQTTILVDDAFLRLVGDKADCGWQDRKHFYRVAARAMRRILIDHERQRRAQRRGGGQHHKVPIEPDHLGVGQMQPDLLALDEALTKLSEVDSRQSEIVELHHFGGCTLEETAKMLEVSPSTVKGEWRAAKAWLHRELTCG